MLKIHKCKNILLTIAILAFTVSLSRSQQLTSSLPIIRSNVKSISIRDGDVFNRGSWNISPELKPDVYSADVKGKSKRITFVTDVDSISYNIKTGDVYQFIILFGEDSALTEIRGVPFIEPAIFSKSYIKEHDRKTFTEIPEVYELVNIAFALTPAHKNVKWADEKRSDYYKEVLDYFDKYSSDPFILKLDTQLKANWYSRMKMDAYAFEFDKNGRIIQSKIYDRISWGKENSLRRLIPELQTFSDKTNFREFFKSHQSLYNAQITAYRDSFNVAEMVNWLNKQFPGTSYNSFKIIWSPLVGGNQSANWFENNDFKESQAHVNFPYAFNYSSGSKAINVRRGNIVFTEINHAYINPEGEKYKEEIVKAFPDKYHWVEKGKAGDSYGSDQNIFNEYMNWALVSLRYLDYAPAAEADSLIRMNEKYMQEGRGFKMFPQFNQFLVSMYKDRKRNETLASLYPKIVEWFRKNQ